MLPVAMYIFLQPALSCLGRVRLTAQPATVCSWISHTTETDREVQKVTNEQGSKLKYSL